MGKAKKVVKFLSLETEADKKGGKEKSDGKGPEDLSEEDLKALEELKEAFDKLPKEKQAAIEKKLKGLDDEELEKALRGLHAKLVGGKGGKGKGGKGKGGKGKGG